MTATAVTRQRRRDTPFALHLLQRHKDFWPIAQHAQLFAGERDWPDVASYARVLDGSVQVRFVEMTPRPRRGKKRAGPIDVDSMYDGQIVRGVVPTRARCWHDFANALVWGAFPAAKRALHARQYRAICDWIPKGAHKLPGARSREMDALALLDEGGVVRVGERAVVFGHALYEGAVLLLHEQGDGPCALSPRRVVAREVLSLPALASEDDAALRARVDAALLALLLRSEPLDPREFVHAQSLFCSD